MRDIILVCVTLFWHVPVAQFFGNSHGIQRVSNGIRLVGLKHRTMMKYFLMTAYEAATDNEESENVSENSSKLDNVFS